MLEIIDLGLTLFQSGEIADADPEIVQAWLQAASDPGVHSPTGFFLTGVRTGKLPSEGVPGGDDRVHLVRLAERWIIHAGCLIDHQEAIEDELFDSQQAILRAYKADDVLRDRMVALWRRERPRAELAERETEERHARYRETHQ